MSTAPTGPRPRDAAGVPAEPPALVMKRTGWDVLLGLLLVATGAFVLGDVAIASVVSVLFVGWTLLVGGVIAVVLALFRMRRGGFWIGLLNGALTLVTGLVFVRNPGVTLLALSLVTGALLIGGGIIRLVLAVQEPDQRLVLAISGVLSVVLGLMVLNRWPESALWLLGTLLGIQIVVDGVLLILLGRPRFTT
jgi:membrane protein HdeD